MARIKVLVLYGGRSPEHEVSCISAKSVLAAIDHKRFDVVAVGIDRHGRWHLQDIHKLMASAAPALPLHTGGIHALPSQQAGEGALLVTQKGKPARKVTFDVVFPVMHGSFGEDGTLQGMLEMMGVPYVGCGVLASALCMDKDIAYRLARREGIPVPDYLAIEDFEWGARRKEAMSFAGKWGCPVFVKPARTGSSVGVSKVKRPSELVAAFDKAFAFDSKVLVQRAILGREIECAVLGGVGDLFASRPAEILPSHDFYSYEAKYLDPQGAKLLVPAPLSKTKEDRVRALALDCFTALDCYGMARVDFLMAGKDGKVYFNEVNTIPGFTSISMYPKMLEASGIPYPKIVERLIALALQRSAKESKRRLVK
ncbi:MAG: D-alanine--D-alanine ligase family protein [Elusimicrobiota bacterium]